MTDSRQNEVQLVKSIAEHTNVAKYFPVKLIRSNAKEDGSTAMLSEEFIMRKASTSEQTTLLDFGGMHGIGVIDVNTYRNNSGSTSDRFCLRKAVFRSYFDVLVIDEADSVSTEEMRLSFLHGVVGAPSQYEIAATRHGLPDRLRYRMTVNKLVAISGTWHRGDEAGYNFLRSLGPITFSVTSRELEEQGTNSSLEPCKPAHPVAHSPCLLDSRSAQFRRDSCLSCERATSQR
jgi:hypothetical protein